jgi:hypothetical protein
LLAAAFATVTVILGACSGCSGGDGGDAEDFGRDVFRSIQDGDFKRFASFVRPDFRSSADNYEPGAGELQGCDVAKADIVVVRKADTGSYDVSATFPTVCGAESKTRSCYFSPCRRKTASFTSRLP